MSFLWNQTESVSHQTLPLNAVLHKKRTATAPELSFSLHNHESLEINVLLEGSLSITVGGREYLMRPGDAVLCNPFDFHSGAWQHSGTAGTFIGFTMMLNSMLWFNRSPLHESCSALLENRYRFDEYYPAGSSRIPEIIQTILTLYMNKSSINDCRCLKLAYELLDELFSNYYHPSEESHSLERNVDFLRNVSAYVTANYTRDISTSDIAEALFMEITQFCHTFKRHFGASFRNYLCQYRCIRAAELYKGHCMSIAEIASAVGFSDYCHFSRSFKKYIGQPPSFYFGKWKNKYPLA